MNVDADSLNGAPSIAPGADYLAVLWSGTRPVAQVYGRADGAGCLDRQLLEHALPTDLNELVCADRPGAPRRTTSVVICTRDRPEALSACLASLCRQSHPPDQIVVVDNASLDDGTRAVALAAGATYVREDRPGLDIARNTGARAATGEIIAYTDDDVLLHPHWLAGLIAAFDRDDILAVTGLVLPAELETESQIIFEKHWSFGRGFRRIDFDRQYFAGFQLRRRSCPAWEIGAGASMAFHRRAFAEVGYFDERLDAGAAGCSGDSEYWYRLLAAGWTCRYEPTAVAFHVHRRDMDGLARQLFAYMRGHVTALLIQFERHGHWPNLRRLAISFPLWFVRRVIRLVVYGSDDSNRLIAAEMRGWAAGILYYAAARWRRVEPWQ